MTDYASKLSSISLKRQKLLEEEQRLIDKRKKEIANLAERCNLLVTSDEILVGAFNDISGAIKSKDNRAKEWQTNGRQFLKPSKLNIPQTQNN